MFYNSKITEVWGDKPKNKYEQKPKKSDGIYHIDSMTTKKKAYVYSKKKKDTLNYNVILNFTW